MEMKSRQLIICFLALTLSASACKKKGGVGNPSPTPGHSASPGASAIPNERYPGLPSSCQALPNGTGGNTGCREHLSNKDSSFVFRESVNAAVTQVGQEHPEFFLPDGTIKNHDGYIRALMSSLNTRGLCGVFNGFELFVRDGRDISEWYNVIWNGQARGFTLRACTPANPMPAFHVSPPSRDPWCPLPNSENTTDNCVSGQLGDMVSEMVLELVAEEKVKGSASQIYDFSLKRSGDGEFGYKIRDIVPFFNRLIEKGHQHSYCAFANFSDTLMLKDPGGYNAFSEAFDVVLDKGPTGSLPAGSYGRSPGSGARCMPSEF